MNATERIRQIRELGLPLICAQGNQTSKISDHTGKDIAAVFDGNIPELIGIENKEGPFFRIDGVWGMESSACGYDPSIKRVLELEGGEEARSEIATEVHAIYDPNVDMTYFFMMPSRKYLRQRGI